MNLQNVLLVFVLCVSSTARCQEKSWGTCAVALQNGRNLTFVIDSAITTTMGAKSLNQIEVACKVWLPLPTMLAATTGLFDTGMVGWNAQARGRSWLSSLPLNATDQDVDKALQGWGKELIGYLASHPGNTSGNDGEISSLFVAYKSNGNLTLTKKGS